MNPTFPFTITNGKLKITNRKAFDDFVGGCIWKDGFITLKKRTKTRSLSQNAYYFGVVLPMVQEGISDTWGQKLSKDEVHEFLKVRYCYKEIVNSESGEITRIPKHTWQLTTTDFMTYLLDISGFALEYLNVVIPEPNEQLKFETE